MAYNVYPSKLVVHYLHKLKDKKLKALFVNTIFNDIANNPSIGTPKHGDLRMFYTYGFHYRRVTYRIAYTINRSDQIVIIALAGPHEGFYDKLKRANVWY